MTHAEQIATMERNHREDLLLIFGEIKSVNKSVTKIETELPHLARRESIIPIIEDETKKQFALHVVECDNKRNTTNGGAKNEISKTIKNAIWAAGISAGVITGIGAIVMRMS